MLGDHIRALKGGRWVHAIDLGDQRVLHLAEEPGLAPGARLRRQYRPEFTAGASTVELVVHRERTYPPRAVVARAWSRFMDPSVVAMFRDSESFAAWCKVGRLPETAPGAAAATAPARAAPAAKTTPRSAVPARPAAAPRAAPKKAAKKAVPARAAKKVVPARTAKKAAPGKAAKKPAPKKAAARKAPARSSKKAAAKKRPAAPAKKKGRR